MADRRREVLALVPKVWQILTTEECSEESGEEMCFVLSAMLVKDERQNKRVCIKNYVECVVSQYNLSDFKSHFRLNRSTFDALLNLIEGKLAFHGRGRPPISPEKQLLCVIWLLSTQESYRSVADRFDVTKSSLHGMFQKVCTILADMAGSVIKWPCQVEAEAAFRRVCGFPGVIGAIDGCHIPIKAPLVAPEKYINRKGFHSVILQAVATSDLCFTHIFCSFPGCVHDSRVFRNSEIYDMCGNESFFPEHTHLIGDSAYPLQINLMVPYKNTGHLANRQVNFNRKLSATRVCVERAFGLLKGRFRRLRYFDTNRIEFLPLYVLAACVLHNICIRECDFSDEDHEDEDNEYVDDDGHGDVTASNKRDYICGLL